MTLTKQIEKARIEVNAETFGTEAWEAKMQIVRDLTTKANDLRPREEYRSIDGDIFDRRREANRKYHAIGY